MTEVALHPVLERAGTFAEHRLGRAKPIPDRRTLRLAHYLDVAKLPTPPPTFLIGAGVKWPMYANDRLGDCTIASAAHMIQGWSKAVGRYRKPTDASVLRAYWQTGYPAASTGAAGGPTDDGRTEIAVLNYWRHRGIGADKITAYVAVDRRDHDEVRAALWLFGGLYTGVSLPVSAQGQPVWDVVGDGKTGDSEPWSWGGHAVPYIGYDAGGLTLVTWGASMRATWAFHDAYTDEAYAILSPDWLDGQGRTIHGFDVKALNADLKAIAA